MGFQCPKCNKEFISEAYLVQHKKKNTNCINKCSICLKIFKTKKGLHKHYNVNCKQRFECENCEKLYTSKYRLCNHQCIPKNIQDPEHKHISAIEGINVGEIVKNIPAEKNVTFNINIYGDVGDKKINNLEINNNNNINNDIKIQNNRIKNFLNTTPRNFNFDYNVSEELKQKIPELIKMNGYDEETADKYMYEDADYQQLPDETKKKYEKEPLNTKGMMLFFKELQKDERNRNVIIQKSKSGKCYVYEHTTWKEKDSKTVLKKICDKICDSMHDRETSLNHYIREVLGRQPRRYSELRKYIEHEIWQLSKIKQELDLIEE